jgi:hypothetical protein
MDGWMAAARLLVEDGVMEMAIDEDAVFEC